MNKVICSICLLGLLVLSGCELTKGLQSAYNLSNCDYKYRSISNLRVMDMNLSNGISAINAAKLLAIFSGSTSSIPLDFTLNLDVYNPNASNAAFQGIQYIVQIDDVEFSKGRVSQAFSVNANETKGLPIQIGADLGQLISTHSKNKILNIAKNFVGLGDEKSNVTVQIKPTFRLGDSLIESPVYIPVSFSFGGK